MLQWSLLEIIGGRGHLKIDKSFIIDFPPNHLCSGPWCYSPSVSVNGLCLGPLRHTATTPRWWTSHVVGGDGWWVSSASGVHTRPKMRYLCLGWLPSYGSLFQRHGVHRDTGALTHTDTLSLTLQTLGDALSLTARLGLGLEHLWNLPTQHLGETAWRFGAWGKMWLIIWIIHPITENGTTVAGQVVLSFDRRKNKVPKVQSKFHNYNPTANLLSG